MASTEELRAELAVRELEDQLAAAKASDDGPTADLKLALRAARAEHRTLRAARPPGPEDVRPATIEASAGVEL